MPARYTKDFKVAIVGGGMCGLTLAIVLEKAGIRCDLFEAAVCSHDFRLSAKPATQVNVSKPKFGEVGAGVGLGEYLPQRRFF